MPEESTTPDLVEVVQRIVAATNARDFDAVIEKQTNYQDTDVARAAAGRRAAEPE